VALGAQWKVSDVKIVEVPAIQGAMPQYKTTYSIEPQAGGSDFDDSKWPNIEPKDLAARRSGGHVAFMWYRTPLTIPAKIGDFDPSGAVVVLTVTVDDYAEVWNSSPHMLGLAFNPVNNFLLILDFGAGNVLNVNPQTGSSSVFMGPIANSGLNALTFDKAGNVYVSDSFNGVIWKTGPSGGAATAWSNDPLLGPGTGLTPPFGANGVEFNNAGTVMYVANTAFHQIIQIPVNSNGTAGTASIFITGINAPDGIAVDTQDNLWVCANQEDEIVVIDKTGKVIAKLGDFGASKKV
jgi:sugar lactone lactonase YvrE